MNRVGQAAPIRIDKWERKKARLEVKAFFYYLAKLITRPFSEQRSKYFKVKYLRTESKISSLFQRKIFKENFVAPGLNYPRTDVMKRNEDMTTGAELLEKLKQEKEKIEKEMNQEIVLVKGQVPSRLAGGICLGINNDVARRFLLKDESIENLMLELEKGGSKEACAAQAVASCIQLSPKKSSLLPRILKSLESAQKAANAPESLQFDLNEFQLFAEFNMLKHSQAKGAAFEKISEKVDRYREEKANDQGFQRMLAAVETFSDFLKRSEGATLTRFPFPALNGEPLKGERILSDLMIDAAYNLNVSTEKAKIIAQLNGMLLNPMEKELGSHFFFNDDAAYLENLANLNDGVYLIAMEIADGAHAVTFIRDKGKDYIIDPNKGQLTSSSKEKTKELLCKLLSEYSSPPSEDKTVQNHRLKIFQYTSAS